MNSAFIQMLDQMEYADTKAALKNANHLLKHEFVFTHPYDMEPYHEIIQMTEIDWLYTPNNDDEWIFMLNRQEYLLDLLVAYQVSNNQLYLDKARFLMMDWLEKNTDPSAKSWRTIDTGIRLLYWSLLVRELKKTASLSEEEEQQLRASLSAQIKYLDQTYITKYELSNWGVLICSGIVVAEQLLSGLCSERCYQQNLRRLKTQITLQIQSSGLHWEQSPLYFMEVWRQLTVVYLSLKQETPESLFLQIAITKMLQVAPYLVRPTGKLLQQGDTDSIFITDMIQTVSLIEQIELPELFSQEVVLDLLLVQFSHSLCQESATSLLTKLKGLSHKPLGRHLIDHETGNYFYRSNWQKNGNYLHVFNGPLGSGHGHASLGHIDLVIQGQDILIDLGRYTYEESQARLQLKSAAAHNTLVLNEQPFCVPKDSWAFTTNTTALNNVMVEKEKAVVIQISYVEEQRGTQYKVIRTYVWLKELEALISFDYCIGANLKKVQQFLNFSPNVNLVTKDSERFLELPKGAHFQIVSNYAKQTVRAVDYAPLYNKMAKTKQLEGWQTVTGPYFLGYTVIADKNSVTIKEGVVRQSGSQAEVPTNYCFGLELATATDTYHVSIQHEDTYQGHKLYQLNGHSIYGKVSLLHNANHERLL